MRRKWLIIVAVLIIGFIWVQSMIPESKSAYESLWFTEHLINPLFHKIGIMADKDMVRKVAHVFEFFLLSILVTVSWKGRVIRSFYTGFTSAFLDETVQVFTGRGALVTDIWIDLIGVVLGTAVGWLIMRRRVKKLI